MKEIKQNWPADSVSRVPVSTLIPYARNARTHSEAQIAQIAASIHQWGWTIPLLVDEQGTIIAGHGRLLAAQKLGIAEVPVMVATGWSEAKRRAYAIADNKLALNAGWDEELLALEIEQLEMDDFDIGLLGFDDKKPNNSVGSAPSKTYDDVEPCFAVQIDVDSEEAQLSMIERMEGEGFKCRALRF